MIQKGLFATSCAALILLLGCTGGGDGGASSVFLTVKAEYENRELGTTGFGPLAPKPCRYMYAEVRRTEDDSLLNAVGLNGQGMGTLEIPRGLSAYALVWADVAVPATDGTLFQHGCVKKAAPQAHYANGDALDRVPLWYSTTPQGEDFYTDHDGTVALLAKESAGEAGAFAIADQMVTFAQNMRTLEPSLRLADLCAFWQPGTGAGYPRAATNAAHDILIHPLSGRPILMTSIRHAEPSADDAGADAYNSAILQETFARSIFTYGSSWTTTTFGQLVRNDTDEDAYVDYKDASESSAAFVNGYSNFLSAAFRNDPYLYAISSSGVINTFRLDQHVGYTPTGGGEFYAGSVARSLWGIWKNALGGNTQGLGYLWDATNPSLVNQTNEYGQTPLASYPAYLTGLVRLASASSSDIRTETNLENVGNGLNPTHADYFNSDTLWLQTTSFPQNGTLTTYAPNPTGWSYYYDQNQAQAYRFTHGGGAFHLTLTADNRMLLLELFDEIGFYTSTTAVSGQAGTIDLATLPAGTYVARVRLLPGVTYANGTETYTLSKP